MRTVRAAVAASMMVLSACGASLSESPAFQRVDPVLAVSQFDPSELDRSIHDLNSAALSAEAIDPELTALLDHADPITRWAAVYVVALAAGPDDVATLVPVLDDPAPANRVIAAGSLASIGHRPALGLLIEALEWDVALPYHDPQRPAAELALEALEAFTDVTFGDAAGWAGWWATSGEALVWNGERYVAG